MTKRRNDSRRIKMIKGMVDHQADLQGSSIHEIDISDQFNVIKQDLMRLKKDILVSIDLVKGWFKNRA